MLEHHALVALEAPASENNSVGMDRLPDCPCGYDHAGDTTVGDHKFLGRALVEDRNAGLADGSRQRTHEGRPAADRLNARGAFRKVVSRLDE
jgi:hypothetical protein